MDAIPAPLDVHRLLRGAGTCRSSRRPASFRTIPPCCSPSPAWCPSSPTSWATSRRPGPRATSVQKCFRTVDIDIIGTHDAALHVLRDARQLQLRGLLQGRRHPLRLGAAHRGPGHRRRPAVDHRVRDRRRGRATSGSTPSACRAERIQRLGEDNFWQMGDTGPCGPRSELFFDRGPEYGADGGPAHGGAERFVEIYNLVFMQYDRPADGTLDDLPRKNIDTGAGLERNLAHARRACESLFETDVFRPVLAAAEDITGVRYGADAHTDVSLRILADHARAMAMLVADGVLPSNEGRGYVLRRVIRRAVRRAFQLGVVEPVTPRLVAAVADVLGDAYPVLVERPRPHLRDGRARGGSLPAHPRRGLGDPRGGAARRDGHGVGRGGLPAARHPRVPHRAHHGDGGRGAASRSTPRASSARWRRSASWPRPTPGAGARPLGDETVYRDLLDPVGADPLHRLRALRGARHGGGGAGRAPSPAPPRSSSTAPPSTPSPAARWATPASSPPRRAGPGSPTPRPSCPGSSCTAPPGRRRAAPRAKTPWP